MNEKKPTHVSFLKGTENKGVCRASFAVICWRSFPANKMPAEFPTDIQRNSDAISTGLPNITNLKPTFSCDIFLTIF